MAKYYDLRPEEEREESDNDKLEERYREEKNRKKREKKRRCYSCADILHTNTKIFANRNMTV